MTPPRQSESVYVLEVGCYENRMVYGIHRSPETAMAAHKTRKKQTWTQLDNNTWSNDLDWDDAASVFRYDLEG